MARVWTNVVRRERGDERISGFVALSWTDGDDRLDGERSSCELCGGIDRVVSDPHADGIGFCMPCLSASAEPFSFADIGEG